ncbi:hypothetical protein BO70DRAFT_393638 [Aspergillus heteromorphus CBS 117.55]|uniref:Uncharacterized protein n=1 Tax=Aspergillus heteromorphus CBS 117.55 TaxID=1448321 RepID=A0A317WSQ9_9EURO|nr:uncharacterized protein BO70DRAFT_393638 [Aspergillus heteromorphus CBS 117.55]PWY89125.1 hypothetical protein BO70DRAFT_393638 [Aspergillus heteromorphus CBS 117.55]
MAYWMMDERSPVTQDQAKQSQGHPPVGNDLDANCFHVAALDDRPSGVPRPANCRKYVFFSWALLLADLESLKALEIL